MVAELIGISNSPRDSFERVLVDLCKMADSIGSLEGY